MKLHVDFDDDLIKKYVKRGSSPIFTIYWIQDQVAYPENQWLDFGSVILSWWLVAAKSLLEGATEAELPFMDGPYCLEVRRFGNQLYVSANDQSWQWRTPIENFVEELLRATREVLRKFDELSVSDKEGLQAGVQHLNIARSEVKIKANVKHAVVAERVS